MSASLISMPPTSPSGSECNGIIDGVGRFGDNRFAGSTKVVRWTRAEDDAALKFWVIMEVLTFDQMRTLIAHMKAGRHRMAADGLRSYELALFMIVGLLVEYDLSDGHDTADMLYIFIHHHVHHHLTDAEREEFFGDGSCAFGATFNQAIEDKMLRGMSTRDSWMATIVCIRRRYVAAAAMMRTLRESEFRHTLTVSLSGGLLDMHNVPLIERSITFAVDGPFVPWECDTTKMFISNAMKKVYHAPCPLSHVATELRRDWRVSKCPVSGNMHIQSDTFYGLRLEFVILTPLALHALKLEQEQSAVHSAAYRIVCPHGGIFLRSQASWRKMLRNEARGLRKEAMESVPTTSALLCASMSYRY